MAEDMTKLSQTHKAKRRDLSKELRDTKTSPERKAILNKALKKAEELADFCSFNGVGRFHIDRWTSGSYKGNITYGYRLKRTKSTLLRKEKKIPSLRTEKKIYSGQSFD